MVNRQRNNRGRFMGHKPIDVRSESQIPVLEEMISTGPSTFILIYADWCGHCQHYKPTWKDFEKTPGRTANIASVHYDMMEKMPTIANAKIQGYPSVIKVEPSGKIEEYNVPGSRETTNAIPEMRDIDTMKKELTTPVTTNVLNTRRNNMRGNNMRSNKMPTRGTLRNTVPANLMMASNGMPKSIPVSSIAAKEETVLPEPPKDSGAPGIQAGILGQNDLLQKNVIAGQSGGQRGGAFESVMGAFIGALQKAGPAALLLLANQAMTKRNKTYKSPKRATRRASTRKNQKNRK